MNVVYPGCQNIKYNYKHYITKMSEKAMQTRGEKLKIKHDDYIRSLQANSQKYTKYCLESK